MRLVLYIFTLLLASSAVAFVAVGSNMATLHATKSAKLQQSIVAFNQNFWLLVVKQATKLHTLAMLPITINNSFAAFKNTYSNFRVTPFIFFESHKVASPYKSIIII